MAAKGLTYPYQRLKVLEEMAYKYQKEICEKFATRSAEFVDIYFGSKYVKITFLYGDQIMMEIPRTKFVDSIYEWKRAEHLERNKL